MATRPVAKKVVVKIKKRVNKVNLDTLAAAMLMEIKVTYNTKGKKGIFENEDSFHILIDRLLLNKIRDILLDNWRYPKLSESVLVKMGWDNLAINTDTRYLVAATFTASIKKTKSGKIPKEFDVIAQLITEIVKYQKDKGLAVENLMYIQLAVPHTTLQIFANTSPKILVSPNLKQTIFGNPGSIATKHRNFVKEVYKRHFVTRNNDYYEDDDYF